MSIEKSVFNSAARKRLKEMADKSFVITSADRERMEEMLKDVRRNPYPREFRDFDWVKIAFFLGGSTVAKNPTTMALQATKGFVLLQHHQFGIIEIHDNGGEINLIAERPAMTEEQSAILSQLEATNIRANRFHVWHKDVSSVPYTSTLGYVTNVVLAYRIRMFLRQEPIDWDWMEKDPEYWTLTDNERAWKENGPDGK